MKKTDHDQAAVGERRLPLLPFPAGCRIARFLGREKRFFVAAEMADETGAPVRVWAHTNNTGSMLGLLRPGAPALLSPAANPARKLAWTLELLGVDFAADAFPHMGKGFWTGVNTSVPNRLLEAAFKAGRLPWAKGYTRLSREKVRGESRIDALLEGPGLPRLWVECKNVTLVEDGIALFPDAVSARGSKHLHTLSEVVSSGERAATFYLVQRPDAACFGPADMVDPVYARAFQAARAAGVEIYPHEALLSSHGIDLAGDCLPLASGC